VGFPMLAEGRWGAFSGLVPEIPMVPADVAGWRMVVGGAADAVPGARMAAGL